ncbi:MAG: transcription antitermination factor NusB, partial [Acidobacteriota bacterium]
MKISPARTAAFDISLRIETERAFSSVLLPMYEGTLSPADASLCHELVLGMLRRQTYLDRFISQLAGNKRIDVEVRIALRLALYQLIYLDKVPPYSAINESVNL